MSCLYRWWKKVNDSLWCPAANFHAIAASSRRSPGAAAATCVMDSEAREPLSGGGFRQPLRLRRERAVHLAGLCFLMLLLAGCRTAATSGSALSATAEWMRPPLLGKSKQQSLREAVEKDPFPRANEGSYRMAVQ